MVQTLLKLASSLLVNADFVLIAVLLGLAARAARGKSKLRARTIALCLAPFVVTHWTPAGRWLVVLLEERFPHPAPFPNGLPEDITGLVLLGGSFVLTDSEDRGEAVHNLAGPRFFESLALARRYPKARIVFTGNAREVRIAARALEEQGVDPSRVTYESESTNTRDNARNTFQQIGPAPGETWVLVTSALHMPRSVGLFRGAGWKVIPYAVNYLTSGSIAWRDWLAVPYGTNALAWRGAAHELLGLAYHYAAGDSPELLPGGR